MIRARCFALMPGRCNWTAPKAGPIITRDDLLYSIA
jgi:hypothetical protein